MWSFFDNSTKKSTAYAKAVLAVKQLSVSNRGKKKLRKRFQKACRSKWLSTEKAIGVYEDYESLLQTLPEFAKKMEKQLLHQTSNLKVSWHSILAARSTSYTRPPEQNFRTRGSLFSIHCSSDRVHCRSS